MAIKPVITSDWFKRSSEEEEKNNHNKDTDIQYVLHWWYDKILMKCSTVSVIRISLRAILLMCNIIFNNF